MMCQRTGALFLLLLVGAAVHAADEGPRKPIRIVLVGDSTVNDEGGWGPGFRAFFGPEVEVINLAKNGRSSKSFRTEGLWEPALAAKPNYILIQFGHNDGPGKGPDRETDPTTTYRENMSHYVEEARAAGAEPVLVTSIVRRVFTADGKIKIDSLVPYVEQVRTLAAEMKVPLLDLYASTLAHAEKLGPVGCEDIDARDKDGKRDRTHLGPKGRHAIGTIAARELIQVVSALQPYAASQANPEMQFRESPQRK
jgi:lysophospholipase L1-like esterase